MPGPPKITLKEARESGAVAVLFYCHAPLEFRFCNHDGEMRLRKAIERWGENLRLDQIPARCTKCDQMEFIDVRTRSQKHRGQGKIVDLDERDAF